MQEITMTTNEFLLADNPLVAKPRTTGVDWCCPSPRQISLKRLASSVCLGSKRRVFFLVDSEASQK